MITDLGELIQIIQPVKDVENQSWEIKLRYETKLPLWSRHGCHLPWNGAIIEQATIHLERYKRREEMVMELIAGSAKQ